MARGRKPIQVTWQELRDVVHRLEDDQPEKKYSSRSELWDAVEQSDWAKSRQPRPLTGQVAMLIAKENPFDIATPLGKRGREKGSGPIGGTRRRRKMPDKARIALQMVTPQSMHSVLDKAASGSLKAAVKLKCMDCAGQSKKEVSLCTIMECSLWSYRPYQRG